MSFGVVRTLAASDVLAALLGVDGAASGLDADLLDGLSSAAFDLSGAATSAVSTHAGLADPHIGYVLESLLDVKGDLYVASANNTPARLAAGSNDQVLIADSAQATGLKWGGVALAANYTASIKTLTLTGTVTTDPELIINMVAAQSAASLVVKDSNGNNRFEVGPSFPVLDGVGQVAGIVVANYEPQLLLQARPSDALSETTHAMQVYVDVFASASHATSYADLFVQAQSAQQVWSHVDEASAVQTIQMAAAQTASPFVIKDSDGNAEVDIHPAAWIELNPTFKDDINAEVILYGGQASDAVDLYVNSTQAYIQIAHHSGGSHYFEAGATPKVGLFGKTPAAQQAKPTDATSIIALLVAYGFCPAA